MNVSEIQDEIVGEFSFLDSWEDKYKYIIDLGRDLDTYPEEFRDDAHKVKGCQSQVWLHSAIEDGKLRFWGDSDALIPKGLISLVLRVVDGQPPAEIAQAKIDFIDRIGLSQNLTPTRSNGLAAMVRRVLAEAEQAL